ncbi:hypothetical protein TrCOL_g12035 [Triparma columacea]|uniref:Uncharacterized protein n=1 Tax=Triparma columacea TaxID=722753 RepID=A0A9W7L2D5_9STRA|nr:hypothetical protein TrCOL_g12035 [Triparma columacea]
MLPPAAEITPEMASRNISPPPPYQPRIVSAASSPPHTPIAIPSPERRHRRTFEILEDELKSKLAFPSFRATKKVGSTCSLGRRTCKNCSIVYGVFGGFVVEDDFCSSDCRTNFDLQAPKESSIYPTNAVPVKVVVGNIRQAAVTEAFNASSAALQPIAIEASGVVAYKRVMPVTVSRGDSMDRAMNTHANY